MTLFGKILFAFLTIFYTWILNIFIPEKINFVVFASIILSFVVINNVPTLYNLSYIQT